MKKTIALLALLVALLPVALTAQTATKKTTAAAPTAIQAVLAYIDDDTQVVITDAKGNPLTPAEGLVLPAGSVVKTLKSTAEIQLKPNGSIIKLSAATTFKINSLGATDGKVSNDFALAAGKIRAVAAKLTGTGGAPGYTVSTPTSNCGVRGTDFAVMFDPANKKDWICVQEGLVDFTNSITGATVAVATSQFANTFDDVFAAGAVDAAQLAKLFSDLDFVKLSPLEVPTKEVTPVGAEAPAAAPEPSKEPVAETPAPAEPDSPVYEFLKKFFGLEVGSVTINGSTYSKAVLSPVIAFDSFKLGLYLPIVYTRDMFDPSDWYRPAGNNEWSFGSDQSDLTGQIGDFANDLALKIKYLEWGNQEFDPYYLKIGNLKTMSLGHGTIVRNFANDQDFPAIRKIGLNAGAKLGGITVEGLADDLAAPAVVGGRLAFDTFGDQVVIGFQAAADLKLANEKDLAQIYAGFPAAIKPAYWGDPVLLVGGVDLQLFKLDGGATFRTKAFADFNTIALYNRESNSSFFLGKVEQGLNTKTLWHDNGLGSFGTEAGFTGNIAVVNYRLSFQAERGLYQNGVFQGNYYRGRLFWLGSALAYTSQPGKASEMDKNLTMGIFGSADFDLFGLLKMDAAYRYPMLLDANGNIKFSDAGDYLRVKLEIPKGKIPFVELSGGVSYERTQFVKALWNGTSLFDSNTVLKGEIVYGLVKGMDLVIGVGTTAVKDSKGNQAYDSNQLPKVAPTISIDTKVSL